MIDKEFQSHFDAQLENRFSSEHDFCLIHGKDYMRAESGNPIPYCAACEEERRTENEREERRKLEVQEIENHFRKHPHG